MPSKKGSKKSSSPEPPQEPERVAAAEEEASAEALPEPPSDPFRELPALSLVADPVRQKAMAAELMGLTDGFGVETMVLDQALEYLLFAQGSGMNAAQARECYRILVEARDGCVAGYQVTENFARFKNAVLDNSVLRTSMREVLAAEAAAKEAEAAAEREREKLGAIDESESKGEEADKAVAEAGSTADDEKATEAGGEEDTTSSSSSVDSKAAKRENKLFTPEMVGMLIKHHHSLISVVRLPLGSNRRGGGRERRVGFCGSSCAPPPLPP